jgi:hypothetical protein
MKVQGERNDGAYLAQRQSPTTLSGATERDVVESHRPRIDHAVTARSKVAGPKLNRPAPEGIGQRSLMPLDALSLNGGSNVVRVTLPLSSLVAMGVPMRPDLSDRRVTADVMRDPFGAVVAVHLVEAKPRVEFKE